MIVVVDDDNEILDLLKEVLTPDGHEVIAHNSGEVALELLRRCEPELIISDVMMPEMDGYEFRKKYTELFPNRNTPFIFLSSNSDVDSIVTGLDLGADDYLVKPVEPEILRAKVRTTLKIRERLSTPMFCGDLAKLPFIKILQFCELKGLTGTVEITSPDIKAALKLEAGQIVIDDEETEDKLAQLYDVSEGLFSIYSKPVDFSEIENSGSVKPEPSGSEIPQENKPAGKLSGIKAGARMFQIQSELGTYPDNHIMTVVILDGKVVHKKKSSALESLERTFLEKMLADQHIAVEAEVRGKISTLVGTNEETISSASSEFSNLFDKGFNEYREGNYAGALEYWEKAKKIKPDDKMIEVNISIAEKKLENSNL